MQFSGLPKDPSGRGGDPGAWAPTITRMFGGGRLRAAPGHRVGGKGRKGRDAVRERQDEGSRAVCGGQTSVKTSAKMFLPLGGNLLPEVWNGVLIGIKSKHRAGVSEQLNKHLRSGEIKRK